MKVLVRLPNWLGDVAMSLPLLRTLQAHAEHLSLVVRVPYKPLVRDFGEVLAFQGYRDLAHLSWRLRPRRYDAGLVLPPSFSSALFLWLAAPRQRIGYASDFRSWLLTHRLPGPRGHRHYVQETLALLEPLGVPLPPWPPPPLRFWFSPYEEAEYRGRCREADLTPGAYVVLAPFAAFGSAKEWSVERFGQVAHRLVKQGIPVVWVGGAGEAERLGPVPGLNWVGQTPLRFLVYLLQHAALVIGNDSGVPHLADILGTPTLMIFGPTDPTWTRPLHGRFLVHTLSCSFCGARECPLKHHGCMATITPEQVSAVALEMLRHDAARSPGGAPGPSRDPTPSG